jgi:hypothetical protein
MFNWRRAAGIGAVTTALVGPVAGFSALPAAAAAKPAFTVVAKGFDNPRGLAVGPNGQLFVAEAGKGGPKCVPGGPGGGSICPGLTGAISVIAKTGAHHRIVTGLASISDQGGIAATGPDGLTLRAGGGLYTIITSCPQQVGQVPPGTFPAALVKALKTQVGQVIKVGSQGKFTAIAPVGKTDWNWSNDHKNLVPGQFPDCNPYGVLAGARDFWVVDAASNTLDHVKSTGTVEVVKFIPNPPASDAVPTCVARGADGALYIGELTGSGNKPGASVVWRFDDRTKALTKWATGLTAVTGCGFGEDGKFYATEFSTLGLDNAVPGTGAVVRVPPHSKAPITVAAGLSFPNGFAAGEDSIYVSNWSISPAVIPPGGPPLQPGEVVRIIVPDGDHD